MFLQPGHLFGGHNDEDYLDDLRRLYTDAGKTNPAFIARAAVLTEDDQRGKKRNINHAEKLPLFSEQVGIDKSEKYEGN